MHKNWKPGDSRTIWHQDNLTQRTILHRQCWRTILHRGRFETAEIWHRTIWHQDNWHRIQFDTMGKNGHFFALKRTETNFSRPNITCLPKIYSFRGPPRVHYFYKMDSAKHYLISKWAIPNFSAPICQPLLMMSNCLFLPMVSNCPWCQIVRFYPWCQIVRCQIVRCQIVCGVKLSAVSNCLVSNCLVSNCLRCQIVRGIKLSWCQIVPQPTKMLLLNIQPDPLTLEVL